MNIIEDRIDKALKQVGDTMTMSIAQNVVDLCRIKGLTVEDVMQGKTPKDIAALWMHRRMSSSLSSENGSLEMQSFPLLPFSKVVQDAMKHDPGATDMWTFPILLRAKNSEIDADRLSKAVNRAIDNHPVFSMHISDDGRQTYEKGFQSPYLKAEVYSQDGYVYLSLNINRILGDAMSYIVLAQDIWHAYRKEPLSKDNYLQHLYQYAQSTSTTEYLQHKEWLAHRYNNPTYPLLPKQDSPEGMLHQDGPRMPHVVCPDYDDRLTKFAKEQNISTNAFFCLVAALAIMDYNGTDSAGLSWAYLGRETRQEMNIFGSLHRDVPLTISRNGDLFRQLRQEIEQGIMHSNYPFTLSSPADSPWHTAVNVLVQPSLSEAMEGSPAPFEFIPMAQSAESYCMLDIDITESPLTLTLHYSARHYSLPSIKRFAALIDTNARMLLENV